MGTSRRCAAILAVLTTLAVSAASQGTTAERPPLRSAAEVDYSPFSLVDDRGAASGFSVELMRAALAAMGRDVTFRIGPWPEVRGWLEGGEVEALPLVGRTPEREELFDFTVPYMTLHGAIVVRRDETGIRDLDDLKGRRVAVMEGDNAEEFLLRQELEAEIRTTETFAIALEELAGGRHDAVVMQRLVALRLVEESGLTELRVVDQPVAGFRQDFCFAVREGDRETLALLNEGLAIVVADGTYRHLHARWFAALQLPTDRPIVIGGDRNFPPFEFLDEDGRPTGFNVDLTRAIARELDLDVEIRLGHWSERIEAVRDGRVDALQGMYYSPRRDLSFDFTQAHTVSHYVAVVRRGERPAPSSAAELASLDIVVEEGDILHEFAVEHGLEERTATVDDQEVALRELVEGRHDCAVVSRITALYLIERNGWTGLELGDRPLLTADYCYAAAPGQRALLAQLGEGLKAVELSGEYRRIQDRWLGVYRQPGSTLLRALRASTVVIVPLLLVLALAFAWSWTLRRQVAEKTRRLHDSLERFQHMFEAANVGKSLTLPSGEVNANRAYADFLGYSLDELEGLTWRELTPPEDVEATERAIAPLLSGESDSTRLEKRYLHKNGTTVWADVSVSIRRDADGRPLHFLTTVVDIDRKKRLEEELREREEFQRAVISCSPVALYSIDADGIVLSWNDSAERIFGWRAAEVVGRPLPIVPPELVHEFDEIRGWALEEGGFVGRELIRWRKDGTRFPIRLSAAPIRNVGGETIGILAAAEDVTEQRLDRQRIEHLNRLLRGIRDVNKLIVRERDRDRLIAAGCRLLVESRGYVSALIVLTEDDESPVSWALEGLAAGEPALAALLEGGQLPPCCRFTRDRGNAPVVEDRPAVCHDCPLSTACGEGQSLCAPMVHDGRCLGYLAASVESRVEVDHEEQSLFLEMVGDFAYALGAIASEKARRSGVEALRGSEARFRLLAETAPLGIVLVDRRGSVLYVSPKVSELLGYTIDDLPSMESWWEQAYPDEAERRRVRKVWLAAADEARRTGTEVAPIERTVTCRDGSERHVEFRMASTGDLDVVILSDITARKQADAERARLESQLAQSQRLEAVGRLAGGVAHDYNNMLSVISGYAELALESTKPDDPLHHDLREIVDAARRSTDITRQLLAFARRQPAKPEVLDLNRTVDGVLRMLRRLIGEDIELAWRPGRDLWPVRMDPSQVDQILANLCVNARDAITGVGTVTIETANVTVDEEYCSDHPEFSPGEYVVLAVSDDGRGMDRETAANAFEPFFTTKGGGRGTGLGLATVFGIVKQNGGVVNLYSEVGRGTTLKLYLPRHVGTEDSPLPRKTAAVPAAGGETVLVVEDEAPVLRLVTTMLERLNYTVLSAATPSDAIALAESRPGGIDLLITDVVMPGMTGRELAGRISDLHPEMAVLFMSGYTADVIAHRGILEDGVHFIQKPFSSSDLAAKVREALGAGAAT